MLDYTNNHVTESIEYDSCNSTLNLILMQKREN